MRKAFKPFAFLAAIAPAFLPRDAAAEVVIPNAQAGPVLTSTGADDLRISSAGSVNLAAPGVSVTVDSSHNFTNQGAVTVIDANNSTAVLLQGGNSGDFLNSGTITNLENFNYVNPDNDNDLDSPFADPGSTSRYALRISGGSPFIGSVTQDSAGLMQVEGNFSTTFLIDGTLQGDIDLNGTVSSVGDNSYAFRSTGVIDGNVLFSGGISALGEHSHAISIENDVTGALRIDGTITANGFRFNNRPSDSVIAGLEPDDMLQGGSALWVRGNVAGGVHLNSQAADLDDLDTDEDDDGILDADETGDARLQSFGESPAMRIGDGGGAAITLGNVGVSADYQFGVVNGGSISAVSLLDNLPGTGVLIENADLGGGFANHGTIVGGSFDRDGAGIIFGNLSTAPVVLNTGSITGVGDSDIGAWSAYGVRVDLGADVPILRNSGTITAQRQGEDGTGYAIADYSDTLREIENSGRIQAVRLLTDDASDTDDSDLLIENEVLAPTARNVAIDLSGQLIGSTVRQVAPALSTAAAPSISGEIWFGSGGDTLDVQAGTITGDIDFGGGADLLQITGASRVTSLLSGAAGLDIDIADGRLNLSNLSTLSAASLDVGSSGILELILDPGSATYGALSLSGNADFATGSVLSVVLRSPVVSTTTESVFTLIDAAAVNAGLGGVNVDLSLSPYLMNVETVVSPTQVQLEMRRRTATELGLNANQTAMYENFFTAALGDSDVMESLLGLGTEQTFKDGLDQFLPNATGSQVEFANTRAQAMTSLLFSRFYGPVQANREIYAWGHELLYSRDREATTSGQGFEGFGFGFAAGVDGPMGKTGYKGFGLSFTSEEFEEKNGEDRPFTVNSVELMGHAVQPLGRLVLGGRVGAGYDWYKSERRVSFTPDLNAPSLSRSTNADWTGAHVSANLRAALPSQVGIFRVRPEVGIDAVSIWEQGYEEEGGGAGIDLAVDATQSHRVSASATVAAGLHWQAGGFIFNPEIMVGARQPLLSDNYETTAEFVSAPGKFALVGDTVEETSLIAGASMTVDGQIGSIRFEAAGESADGDTSVTGRVVVRLTF